MKVVRYEAFSLVLGGVKPFCFVFIVKVIRISFLHDVTQCDSLRYCLKNPSIFPSSVHACIRIQFSMDWHRPIVESEMQK